MRVGQQDVLMQEWDRRRTAELTIGDNARRVLAPAVCATSIPKDWSDDANREA